MVKVLGIGNALVDIMTMLESDDFLHKHNLPKGSMQLVDIDVSNKVYKATGSLPKTQSSGGSVANAIHALACLGGRAAYIGKVGKDEMGAFFRKDMEDMAIETFLFESNTLTGIAIALISPDSERTFATHLGAAVELHADELTPELFSDTGYFLLEGYLVFNEELITRSAMMAKEAGLMVAIDLASFNVVEAKLDFLRNLVEKYVDIVFANEDEARAFTGKEPEEALDEIAKMSEIAVVKIGKKGSLIKCHDQKFKVGVIKVIARDTTGAGDSYAAGFLYGMTKKLDLEKCGKIGAVVSGNVIEVVGSKMDKARWAKIIEEVRKIEYS